MNRFKKAIIPLILLMQVGSLLWLAKIQFDDSHRVISVPVTETSRRTLADFPACGKKVCEVQFQDMVIDRVRYEERRIRVVGYLAIQNGSMLLFATEHDYIIRNTGAALQIRFKQADQKRLYDIGIYSYIELTATYSSGDVDAKRANYLGVLRPPYEIFAIDMRPKKEFWGDIKMNVEDIRP
jgi:hypothetical protein